MSAHPGNPEESHLPPFVPSSSPAVIGMTPTPETDRPCLSSGPERSRVTIDPRLATERDRHDLEAHRAFMRGDHAAEARARDLRDSINPYRWA